MPASVYVYPDPDSVAKNFAAELAEWLNANPTASIAISGGSTPKALFGILAEHYNDVIDWEDIHIFWVDERMVPPEHKESNFRVTNKYLLRHIEIPKSNVHRIRGEEFPQAESRRYAEEIRKYVLVQDGYPIFDRILLGMGADGHTASIFPDQMALLESDQIAAVAMHPETKQRRITLTGPVINRGKVVDFLVTGEAKAETVGQIFEHQGDYESYPAAHIHPAGRLNWYMDEAAAVKVEG